MKKLLFILPAGLLMAQTFNQIVSKIDKSYIYQIAKKEINLARKNLKIAKAKNLGSLDASYTAVRLFNTPLMKSVTPMAVKALPNGDLIYENFNIDVPMGTKHLYTGEIAYSYPIFTGYAISNYINVQKLNLIKSKLKFQNTKRVLILKTAKLYSLAYALKMQKKALVAAKEALKTAREKAYAFYQEGLLNISEVNEIDAKYYDILAQIRAVKEKENEILNILSSLLNYKVDSIEGLPDIKLQPAHILQRPDLKVLKTVLKIANYGIKLSKSKFYPQIGFQAAWKHQTQNWLLSENNYRNKDESYLALEIKYNIFNGGADKAAVEKAKIKKYQAFLYYKNYLNKAKTDYKNDINQIKALKFRLKAAKEEIKARVSYYEYIYAKFKEGLADSSKLNDAIAKLAAARAKKDAIKADIFYYTLKANFDGGSYELY